MRISGGGGFDKLSHRRIAAAEFVSLSESPAA